MRTRLVRPPGLYRSRSGIVLGVLRGIAEYFDFPVIWVRVAALAALLFTGVWPVTGLYFLAAILMKPEPVLPLKDDDEREFYESFVSSRSMALSRLKRGMDNLDRRIRRMEDTVTSRDFEWTRRFSR